MAKSALSKGSHEAALAMPTEVQQVSTAIAGFPEPEATGRTGDIKCCAADNPTSGQSPVPSPSTYHTAAIASISRKPVSVLASVGMARLPHRLFPEDRMLLETRGSALGKAVPPQALKKGLCSCSAFFIFFFFPIWAKSTLRKR